MSSQSEIANRLMLRARDAMDRAYRDQLDIAELARVACVSEAHFIRSFELVTKGAMGGWLCLTTDDAQAVFETLRDRGVDITDEPSPKQYGIDFGIRDPFGNAIRIGQMFDGAQQ